jgi:hypothetical protein
MAWNEGLADGAKADGAKADGQVGEVGDATAGAGVAGSAAAVETTLTSGTRTTAAVAPIHRTARPRVMCRLPLPRVKRQYRPLLQ